MTTLSWSPFLLVTWALGIDFRFLGLRSKPFYAQSHLTSPLEIIIVCGCPCVTTVVWGSEDNCWDQFSPFYLSSKDPTQLGISPAEPFHQPRPVSITLEPPLVSPVKWSKRHYHVGHLKWGGLCHNLACCPHSVICMGSTNIHFFLSHVINSLVGLYMWCFFFLWGGVCVEIVSHLIV